MYLCHHSSVIRCMEDFCHPTAVTYKHLYVDSFMFSCTSPHSLLLSIAGLFAVPFISAILSKVKPAFSWPISSGFSCFCDCGPPIKNMVRRNITEPATNSKCASFISTVHVLLFETGKIELSQVKQL